MPNRILREGILTSERVERLNWADPASLQTEADVLRVRQSLPKLTAGDPLQGYKWALSMRLRAIRKKAAGPLSAALVRRMVSEAGQVCGECGFGMGAGAKRTPTLDHVVALANGGRNDLGNLRIICNRCNSRKADRA